MRLVKALELAASACGEPRLAHVALSNGDRPTIDVDLLSDLDYGPRMIGQTLIRSTLLKPGKWAGQRGNNILDMKALVIELDDFSTKLEAVIAVLDNSEEA
jgi:hypothetical protein